MQNRGRTFGSSLHCAIISALHPENIYFKVDGGFGMKGGFTRHYGRHFIRMFLESSARISIKKVNENNMRPSLSFRSSGGL